jgi:hypothetical protein
MYSYFEDKPKNFTGDYVIFSMSKMLPMQSCGLLYVKDKTVIQNDIPTTLLKYYKCCFRNYHLQREDIIQKRVNNYFALSKVFESYNLKVRFPLKPKETPGAFVFCASGINLDNLKIFMQRQGIECGIFYGEEAFYIPCHQNMDNRIIEYIETLIKTFLG